MWATIVSLINELIKLFVLQIYQEFFISREDKHFCALYLTYFINVSILENFCDN